MRRVLQNPLVRAGLVLGVGFGGFIDGIVLHQILGWHHLVCVTARCEPETVAQLQRQNVQDGFFHLLVWVITLAGAAMLFRAGRHAGPAWSGRVLAGAMLAGWGLFNVVEGVVDHHILGIHHVLPGHPQELLLDLLFLVCGVTLGVIGLRLARTSA